MNLFNRDITLFTGNMQTWRSSTGLERLWHRLRAADTGGKCLCNHPYPHRTSAFDLAAIHARAVDGDGRHLSLIHI